MSPKLTVLLSWWLGWRPIYDPSHVRALVAQIRHYVFQPIRIALLTDQAVDAKDVGVDLVTALPAQGAASPEQVHRPNCYRRLRFFDPAYTLQFGTEWIVSLDLDTLIMSAMDDLLDYAMRAKSGLTIVRSRFEAEQGVQRYNGSFFAIKVGSQRQVWDTFDWEQSPAEVAQTRWVGSDQVWIALKAPGAMTVGEECGVYFCGQYMTRPHGARPAVLVTAADWNKPWSKTSKRTMPELHAHYQRFAGA